MKKTASKLLLPIILVSFVLTACQRGTSDLADSNSAISVDPETTYTVTFDMNYEGSPAAPAPQTIYHGGLVAEPTAPVQIGHDFKHWSSDVSGSSIWNFASDTVLSDLTLYAIWEITVPKSKVFYVSIPEYWKSNEAVAGIYLWNVALEENAPFPGMRMTKVADDVFSFEVEPKYTHAIFTRLNPSEPTEGNPFYWRAKTVDIVLSSAMNYNLYVISNDGIWGDPGCGGTWSTYSA